MRLPAVEAANEKVRGRSGGPPKEPPVYVTNGVGADGPISLPDRVRAGTRLQRFDDTDRWPVFAAPFNSQAVDLGSY